MYRHCIKRLLDIVLSLIAIILLSPLYIIIAIIVRIQMGSPILFSQDRIGKNEKIFKLYKFRSMTNEKDAKGNLLSEKDRLTKFGIALRSTSLDELPELFMILKGDMSIVGPRPQPAFYLPYYRENERVAHRVRGGLLPPDCLSKEVQCDWETQLRLEAYYAEKLSFSMDVKVLICTFIILYKRIKNNYGADDRPMLNVYREGTVSEETLKEWEEKGVSVR
ncbi:sugar transferase [Eubacterium sp. MSJ-33]|uniref:sugar transferase n=1 Tax=Eubacterium sp. MSJ-33 TaxID=2841528 RepID=UPI001C767E58|nr:sugar transferase [Eubacterium sp. MSJ-33]QWT52219.1 sugar transferase [Eubacterium sp. MSJ-33]